jgi:hypothetical protein
LVNVRDKQSHQQWMSIAWDGRKTEIRSRSLTYLYRSWVHGNKYNSKENNYGFHAFTVVSCWCKLRSVTITPCGLGRCCRYICCSIWLRKVGNVAHVQTVHRPKNRCSRKIPWLNLFLWYLWVNAEIQSHITTLLLIAYCPHSGTVEQVWRAWSMKREECILTTR